MLSGIDEYLFFLIFELSGESPLLGSIMVVITNWSSRIFAVIYLAGLGMLLVRRSKKLIPFLIAPAAALIMVQLIRYFYVRPRPFVALEIESLINHGPTGSFPSRHAVGAFVIAAVIWQINKRTGKILFLLAAVTGLSRVMVGVHYPLDIIAGALLAVATGLAAFAIQQRSLADESKE